LKSANDFTGGPQEFGVRGGLGGLLRHHAAELRGGVRLSSPVIAIDHGDPQRVRVTLQNQEQLIAARVVVAVSPATAGKTIAFEPALDQARQCLHAQPMGHACKAVIQYDEPWWRDSHGHHFIGWGGGAGSRGSEWGLDASDPASKPYSVLMFLNPVLLRDVAPDADRATIERLVIEELVRMSGDVRARDYQALDLFDWTAEPFIGGGPNTITGCGVLSQLEAVFRRPERPHGRLYFTAAEYASEYCGYVEGALQAGEFTAMQVLRDMELPGKRPKSRARGSRPLLAIGIAAAYALIRLVARIVAALGRKK
jgi:monoamine oxidase